MDSYSLKRMESYLSNVINSMPSLIFVLDPQWRVTQWNQEAVNRTQIQREQALGLFSGADSSPLNTAERLDGKKPFLPEKYNLFPIRNTVVKKGYAMKISQSFL